MAKVLVVDDEESDRAFELAVLKSAGHEVFVASSGEDALRACLDFGIDVVVTDLQMPGVHGFELITVLRDLTPPPSVVAVSGTGDFQLHMAGELGAVETVSKPVDPQGLLAAVERAVAARRSA